MELARRPTKKLLVARLGVRNSIRAGSVPRVNYAAGGKTTGTWRFGNFVMTFPRGNETPADQISILDTSRIRSSTRVEFVTDARNEIRADEFRDSAKLSLEFWLILPNGRQCSLVENKVIV